MDVTYSYSCTKFMDNRFLINVCNMLRVEGIYHIFVGTFILYYLCDVSNRFFKIYLVLIFISSFKVM